MHETKDMLGGDKPKQTPPPVKSWQMVTNHLNLFYMLGAGLIMPPKGFGNKYYQDTAAAFPGYLPIFPNNAPSAAVDYSVSEAKHLKPCILNLDFSKLQGRVKMVTQEGDVNDVIFPDEVDSACQCMLVPAPLPMSYISGIIFQSKKDKIDCEKDCAQFNNVDLSTYKKMVTSGAFTKQINQDWPPKNVSVEQIDITLDLPMAAGAMMGLFVNMSNRNALSVLAARLAFEPDEPLSKLKDYPVITAMREWLKKGDIIETDDVPQKLFWGIVGRVAVSKYSAVQSNSTDVAIDYLSAMPSEQFDKKTRDYGKKLASDLKGVSGIADSTISEIFERHPKSVSRVMVLFILRERVDELLEFDNQKLSDADYILAAILFAARDGWIGISIGLRQPPGLDQAVTHRMAAMSHRISDTGLDLGQPPARPKSLIELLSPDSDGWSKRHNEAALHIARKLKWECIKTRIDLGKGDYQLSVKSSGIQLMLDGDVKAVNTEVVKDQFIHKLRDSTIDAKLEREVRGLLQG